MQHALHAQKKSYLQGKLKRYIGYKIHKKNNIFNTCNHTMKSIHKDK